LQEVSRFSSGDLPSISIIIPTYNSERTLIQCLESIAKQNYPREKIEVIVVDGYSQDQTIEIARKYGARIYFSKALSDARRLGVEKSLSKYILFIDSDQVIGRPDIIRKCVDKCEKEGYDAITLFERSIIEKNTFIERVIAYDKWLFHSQRDDHPVYGTAIPRFFRAEVLKKIKWPKGLAVQEHNLIYYRAIKAGAKVTFTNDLIYHYEPSSFAQFVRKFYRYGLYYVPALHEDKKLVISHSMPRRVYFSKRALMNPLLFSGLFLLYFIKGFSIFAGVLAYCFRRKECFLFT
jgi:glycosyltransferase involved in cell wall biosynthesis